MKSIIKLTLVFALVTFFGGLDLSSSAQPPLSLYQQCVACTGVGKRFLVNKDSGETRCQNMFSFINFDGLEVTKEEKCSIFNPEKNSCPPPPPPCPSIDKTTKAWLASLMKNVSCNCTCPTAEETKPSSTMTMYQQCVLCIKNGKHFRVNTLTQVTGCTGISTIHNSEVIYVSNGNDCNVLK